MVSGINHGSNSSINVLYSGTMSAAMEAGIDGIQAIGFSYSHFGFDAPMQRASKEIKTIAEQLIKNPMWAYALVIPMFYLININGKNILKALANDVMFILVYLLFVKLVLPSLDRFIRARKHI